MGANVLPHEQQVIGGAMLEKWDYCLRRLFVLKGQSLKAAIGYASRFSTVVGGYDVDPDPSFSVDRSLAPGAQSLLKTLTDPTLPPEERVDINKQIRRLDVSDWALILRAFSNWPFAPEVCSHLLVPSLSCWLSLVLTAFGVQDLLIHDTYNPTSRDAFLK